MVKVLFLVLVLLGLCLPLYSESLDEIFALCRWNSFELREAENELSFLRGLSKETYGKKNPKLVFDLNLNFPESSVDLFGMETGVEFTKFLSSSTGLSLAVRSSLEKDKNARYEWPNDGVLMISFSINQSLFPFWIQGESSDPYSEILSLKMLNGLYSKELLEKDILKNVTISYITARRCLYLIDSTSRIISVYDQILEAIEKPDCELPIELLNEALNYNELRWNQIALLEEYASEFSNLITEMSAFCGKKITVTTNDSLPNHSSNNEKVDFTLKEYQTAIELIRLEKVLCLQSSAPQLSFSISSSFPFELTQKKSSMASNNYSWSSSVGLDLSSFFSSSKKELELTYKRDFENAKTQHEKKEVERILYLDFLKSKLEGAEFQKKELESMLVIYTEKYSQMSQMVDLGAFSFVELKLFEIKIKQIECSLKIMHDNMWLYMWLRDNV